MELAMNIKNSMKGWYFPYDVITTAIMNKVMINPSIDFTNACNLNCPYCYIEEKNSIRKERKAHELTYEESIKIIDEFARLGAQTINIVGAGEPTIDGHFYKIIEYIYSLGITTVLFTNGIKLTKDEKIIDFLFTHDVTVVLKMNSFDAKTQDLMAGRNGYHQETMKALELLMQKGFNAPVLTRLSINCVICKGNLQEIPAIHRFCRENNIYPMMGDFIPTGRTETGKFIAEKAISMLEANDQEAVKKILEPIDFANRIFLQMELAKIDKPFDIPRSGCSAYYGGSICTQIIGLYVDILGNIWPCVARSKVTGKTLEFESGLLGNVRQGDTIETIWKTDPYMDYVRKHFNGGCPYKMPIVD